VEILAQLYGQIAGITEPLCGNTVECNNSYGTERCCSREYCELARAFAKKHYNLDLKETGNPNLPFMGKHGCTVKPHLRPICSLHCCKTTQTYLDLRAIVIKESREQGKAPISIAGLPIT
jgi:hypothetical protein